MWDQNPTLLFRKFPEQSYEIVEYPSVPYSPGVHCGHFKLWLEQLNTTGDFLVLVNGRKAYSYRVEEIPKPSVEVQRI